MVPGGEASGTCQAESNIQGDRAPALRKDQQGVDLDLPDLREIARQVTEPDCRVYDCLSIGRTDVPVAVEPAAGPSISKRTCRWMTCMESIFCLDGHGQH